MYSEEDDWRGKLEFGFNMRNSVLNPPSYDPKNIVDLLDKHSDTHIILFIYLCSSTQLSGYNKEITDIPDSIRPTCPQAAVALILAVICL